VHNTTESLISSNEIRHLKKDGTTVDAAASSSSSSSSYSVAMLL